MRLSKTVRRTALMAALTSTAIGTVMAWGPATEAAPKGPAPKYFFQLRDVKGGADIDPALKSFAGEALKADSAARPEWASDVQAASPEALVAELDKRNLRGFDVTVRFEEVHKEVKPPKPGGRFNQLAVNCG